MYFFKLCSIQCRSKEIQNNIYALCTSLAPNDNLESCKIFFCHFFFAKITVFVKFVFHVKTFLLEILGDIINKPCDLWIDILPSL